MVDLDELLKLIDETEQKNPNHKKVNKKKDNKEVIRFIQTMSVKPGAHRVPGYLIYYNYVLWTRGNHHKLNNFCSKNKFMRTFNRHFEQIRSGIARYYLIDPNTEMDISKEMKIKAKKYIHKGNKRVKKEKK